MRKFLFIVCLLGALNASAYDFAVENSDKVMIYYNKATKYGADQVEVTRGNKDVDRYTGNVVIPQTVTYSGETYQVRVIGSEAFEECTGLTGITLPGSVTKIGISAFTNCTGLTEIILPNSITIIEESAFYGCTGLTEVSIPASVEIIRGFQGCTGLQKVTIPNTVSEIDESAFYGCTALENITIPNSVTEIGRSAFRESGLKKVVLPASITNIQPYTFADCARLAEVTIPNSVRTIQESAFADCTGLTEITLPNSIEEIGGGAFQNSALTQVTIPGSVKMLGELIFWRCNLKKIYNLAAQPQPIKGDIFRGEIYQDCVLYVPVGSKSSYLAADGWRNFANIVEMDMTGIDTPASAAASGAYYDLSGREVGQPTKGIYIQDGKKVFIK